MMSAELLQHREEDHVENTDTLLVHMFRQHGRFMTHGASIEAGSGFWTMLKNTLRQAANHKAQGAGLQQAGNKLQAFVGLSSLNFT